MIVPDPLCQPSIVLPASPELSAQLAQIHVEPLDIQISPNPGVEICLTSIGQGLLKGLGSFARALQEFGECVAKMVMPILRALCSEEQPARRPYPRHTRQRIVLARRRQLGLDQDGKIPGLYEKRCDAYAYARYVNGLSAKLPPHPFVRKKTGRRYYPKYHSIARSYVTGLSERNA